MLYAFKDHSDGYYQIELNDGEALPEWTKSLVPCPVIALPDVVVVPQQVTRFQALAALHSSGLLDQVETMMAQDSTDTLTKLAWQNAQVFKRYSPMVLSMAKALCLSDPQLDGLFIDAAQIE